MHGNMNVKYTGHVADHGHSQFWSSNKVSVWSDGGTNRKHFW